MDVPHHRASAKALRDLDMAMGQNETTRRPQVLVLGSIYQVPFWAPIFDPQPYWYFRDSEALGLPFRMFVFLGFELGCQESLVTGWGRKQKDRGRKLGPGAGCEEGDNNCSWQAGGGGGGGGLGVSGVQWFCS